VAGTVAAKVRFFLGMTKLFERKLLLCSHKTPFIESTSKCKFVAKLGKMFEKDLIWGKEI